MTAKKRTRRGFTLIELIVALAIAIILLGVSVPGFYRMSSRGRLNAEARKLMAQLRKAQMTATSGASDLCPNAAVERAVLRLMADQRTYETWVFCTTPPPPAITPPPQRISVQWIKPEANVVFTQPAPFSLTWFRRDGTIQTGSATRYVLVDNTTTLSREISVTLTGQTRITN